MNWHEFFKTLAPPKPDFPEGSIKLVAINDVLIYPVPSRPESLDSEIEAIERRLSETEEKENE